MGPVDGNIHDGIGYGPVQCRVSHGVCGLKLRFGTPSSNGGLSGLAWGSWIEIAPPTKYELRFSRASQGARGLKLPGQNGSHEWYTSGLT